MRDLYWVKRKVEILKVLRYLRAHDRVVDVRRCHHFIRVKYKNGIAEYWYLHRPRRFIKKKSFAMPKRLQLIIRPIPTYSEFETSPFDDARNALLKPFFIVQAKDIARSGFVDIRLKVQEIVDAILEEGWIDPKYPPEVLKREWAGIKSASLPINLLWRNPWQPYGFHLITHFMPVARYRVSGILEEFSLSSLWRRNLLYRTINKLIRQRRDITRATIIKMITKILSHRYLKITSPLFYRLAFEEFTSVKGKTVLDLTPMWGVRALATWAEGGEYYHPQNYVFTKKLNEMAAFLGHRIQPDDGVRRYNLVIANDFIGGDKAQVIERIAKYAGRADNIMAILRKDMARAVHAELKPKQVIDLRSREKYLVIV